jgi:hypothetical protein
MSARTRVCVIAVLVASAVAGCIAERLEPDVGPLRTGLCKPEDSDPDHDVSFRKQVLPIFKRPAMMAGCSCHLPTSARTPGLQLTGLDLSSYKSLRRGGNQSGANVVIAHDPCNSLLVQKISSAPPFGGRMPSDGPPYLTPPEQTLISDWIAEGAVDN